MTDHKLIGKLNKEHPLCQEVARFLTQTSWGAHGTVTLHPTTLVRWAAEEAGMRDSRTPGEGVYRVDDVGITALELERLMGPTRCLETLMKGADGQESGLLASLKTAETPEEAARMVWEALTA